ncbi:MAG: Cytochrome c oxidase assembly protein CtaG/Cox11 [Betaproteobacteria bacterium]|nr:Cytochrome c oxidase assembly protein CtaG/Cox11 [Betaproteobacteria bacterium]
MVTQTESNLLTMRKLAIVAVGMFGFGFALIPFYQKICEVTGVNNVLKADTVGNTQIDTARMVTIEFDSNLSGKLPWSFRPLQTNVRVHPGELTTVMYEIRNNADHAVTGQAIPSYGPQIAIRYFKKLECFCFTQQTLKPGEAREMPVVFVLEHGLPADINTITLSYSFFEIEGTARKAS